MSQREITPAMAIEHIVYHIERHFPERDGRIDEDALHYACAHALCALDAYIESETLEACFVAPEEIKQQLRDAAETYAATGLKHELFTDAQAVVREAKRWSIQQLLAGVSHSPISSWPLASE